MTSSFLIDMTPNTIQQLLVKPLLLLVILGTGMWISGVATIQIHFDGLRFLSLLRTRWGRRNDRLRTNYAEGTIESTCVLSSYPLQFHIPNVWTTVTPCPSEPSTIEIEYINYKVPIKCSFRYHFTECYRQKNNKSYNRNTSHFLFLLKAGF